MALKVAYVVALAATMSLAGPPASDYVFEPVLALRQGAGRNGTDASGGKEHCRGCRVR